MELPEVTKCFGVFPPKYATYMISLFGLSSGGVGLVGIILYGLIEKAVAVLLYGNNATKLDDSVKKVVLLTIGLTSIFLLVANTLLFLGATANSAGSLSSGIYVILVMCMVLVIEFIFLPLSCFFNDSLCVVKKLSTGTMVLLSLIVFVFLELWFFFMLVANTYLSEL